jgi:hypothetical protein
MVAKRFKTNEKAHVEVYGHTGTVNAAMRNLSETGAFLEVSKGDYIPRKGDLLNLTVPLATLQKSHNVAAEVIWSTGMRLGICFISKDEVLERMMAKSGTL